VVTLLEEDPAVTPLEEDPAVIPLEEDPAVTPLVDDLEEIPLAIQEDLVVTLLGDDLEEIPLVTQEDPVVVDLEKFVQGEDTRDIVEGGPTVGKGLAVAKDSEAIEATEASADTAVTKALVYTMLATGEQAGEDQAGEDPAGLLDMDHEDRTAGLDQDTLQVMALILDPAGAQAGFQFPLKSASSRSQSRSATMIHTGTMITTTTTMIFESAKT